MILLSAMSLSCWNNLLIIINELRCSIFRIARVNLKSLHLPPRIASEHEELCKLLYISLVNSNLECNTKLAIHATCLNYIKYDR